MLAKFVNGCLYIIHITKGSPKLTQAYSYHFTISVPNYKAKKKKKKKKKERRTQFSKLIFFFFFFFFFMAINAFTIDATELV